MYKISHIQEVTAQHQKKIQESCKDFTLATDVLPTGFKVLDQFCNGLMRGDVISILGPASMGKTAFVINLIFNSVLRDEGNMLPVLYFSLDKKPMHIMEAFISHISQLDEIKIKANFLNAEEKGRLEEARGFISRLPIHFVEGLVSFEEIKTAINEMVKTHRIRLVVIDSVNSIYENDILNGLKKIKEIALQEEAPIILTNRLSLKLDSWANITEKINSGVDTLNQEVIRFSDVVGVLHRDEYYTPTDLNRGDAKLWLIKNKNGPGAFAHLRFDRRGLKFSDCIESA